MDGEFTFECQIYIETSADEVWNAITDPERSARFWGHQNVSEWEEGSTWEHRRTDGSEIADVVGQVLESQRPSRLTTTWVDPNDDTVSSVIGIVVDVHSPIVRVTVTGRDFVDEADCVETRRGFAAVLSNLKTMLETGDVLPVAPWEMP